MDKHEAHKLLNQEVLSAAKGYYSELVQNRAALDKKAEGTVSIAGIFLAAVFAFARELGEGALIVEKVMLGTVVVLLICTVVLSLLALQARKARTAPPAVIIRKHVGVVIRSQASRPEDEYLAMAMSALNTLSGVWDEASKDVLVVIEKKGRLVKLAQCVLFAASVLVAAIVIFIIVHTGHLQEPVWRGYAKMYVL